MYFRVVNNGNNKASNIVLKLKLGEYTDWESINLSILAPGDYIDPGWNPIVNEGILEITNDQEVPVYAEVEFTDESGELHTEDASFGVEILGRDHTSSYTSYAQYVTITDPNVRKFASAAVTGSTGTDDAIHEAAKEIWDLLGSYGIAYISDPNYFNYAQYPAETLKNKKGDCEDLAILYASLLESIGVKAALIRTPGHVFAAYYTSQYINPMETTMIGSDFTEANNYGIEEYNSHCSDEEIINIEDEFDRGIKPPGEIDVGTIEIPIISVTTDADSSCTCADYSFWGNCNYYTLNAWGYVTFSNSGDGQGEKCGTAYLLQDGYQIASEHICVTVPPYDTVTKIISRTMDVNYCGYISCTFYED